MRALCVAFSMYSKLPMPQVEWDKKSLSWALVWFPIVGLVEGLLLWGWLTLCGVLSFSGVFRAVGCVVLPALYTGGIHLDGFCDTCDALGSHQPREKKLEILKDSHTGAFAVLCLGLYLLAIFGCWFEVRWEGNSLYCLCLAPVLSRALSGVAAASWRNARGSGLLAAFTEPMEGKKARILLILMAIATSAGMLALDLVTGLGMVIGAIAAFLYYFWGSYRQFGGITGDLAGFFLQICECAVILGAVLAQKAAIYL